MCGEAGDKGGLHLQENVAAHNKLGRKDAAALRYGVWTCDSCTVRFLGLSGDVSVDVVFDD